MAEARIKILISYFKPFKGNSENHTKAVAKALKQHDNLKDFDIILCPIKGDQGVDVSFYSPRTDLKGVLPLGNKLAGDTSAFQQVKSCLDDNPDVSAVYSLGEGTCKVTYENVAYNVMETGYHSLLADHNKNLVPTAQKFDSKGPDSVILDNFKNIEAFCLARFSNNGFENMAQPGTDPGTYICNNHAYNMQRYIESNNLPVSFDFIHIPVAYGRESPCPMQPQLESEPERKRKTTLTNLVADNISQFVTSKNLLTRRVSPESCVVPEILPEIPPVELLLKSPDIKECIEEKKMYVESRRLMREEFMSAQSKNGK